MQFHHVLKDIFKYSVEFSCSVLSDSLQPYGPQHVRLPCPSPTAGACSNSCPSSQWCHPTNSFSVIPFSCLQPQHSLKPKHTPGKDSNSLQFFKGWERKLQKSEASRGWCMRSKERSHQFISVKFSHSLMSNSLWPHGLQHARPPCPSPTPRVYSNSCPLSHWYHPTISFSGIPFSSCLQSFPASGYFQMSQLFTSGGQSLGASASV